MKLNEKQLSEVLPVKKIDVSKCKTFVKMGTTIESNHSKPLKISIDPLNLIRNKSSNVSKVKYLRKGRKFDSFDMAFRSKKSKKSFNRFIKESDNLTFISDISSAGKSQTMDSRYKIKAKNTPSLVEKMEIVKAYWKKLNNGELEYEIPMKNVAKLLSSKVVPDMETAYKVIRKAQHGFSSSTVNYDEFKRIF